MPFIDTRNRSKSINIDYSNSVYVVVSHATDGRFIPLYFRALDNEGVMENYKINSIKYSKEKHGYTTFCCLITNCGYQKEIYLTYYISNHVWVLNNPYFNQ